jgi:hypothetical protein
VFIADWHPKVKFKNLQYGTSNFMNFHGFAAMMYSPLPDHVLQDGRKLGLNVC